jgi:hypothetical protein
MIFAPFVRFSLRACFLVAAAVFLCLWSTGCAMIYDAARDNPSRIVGRRLGALTWTRQIEWHDGRLLACVSGDWWGIAAIDTSADTVTALLRPFSADESYGTPWSIASLRDSLLYAVSPYEGTVRVAGSSGAWADVQQASPTSVPLHSLQAAGGDVFLYDRYGRDVRRLTGTSSALLLRLPSAENLMSLAASGERLFVVRSSARDLIVAGASNGTVLDSIRFDSLPGRPGLKRIPEMVVAHGARIFVSMSVRDSTGVPDTAVVAVFDTATLALDTIIPLKYTFRTVDTDYPFTPRVADGKWYLPGYGAGDFNGGGVEVIDLDEAKRLPEVVIPYSLDGQRILDFLPAGPGKAYVITDAGGYRKIRRVSY